MLKIKMGPRKYVGGGKHAEAPHPFLKRDWTGFDEAMTDDELLDAARGWWVLSQENARKQRYALVVGDALVRLAVKIDGWEANDLGRRAFSGSILAAGHPVHDAWVGREVEWTSRNPIGYEDSEFDLGPCECGCGEQTRGSWVPGHDQRAIHTVIRENFAGSVLKFIEWCRANPDLTGVPRP